MIFRVDSVIAAHSIVEESRSADARHSAAMRIELLISVSLLSNTLSVCSATCRFTCRRRWRVRDSAFLRTVGDSVFLRTVGDSEILRTVGGLNGSGGDDERTSGGSDSEDES